MALDGSRKNQSLTIEKLYQWGAFLFFFMSGPVSSNEQFQQELLDGLRSLISGNPKAERFLDFLEGNRELQTLISHGNTLVIGRLNYNDHGTTHSRIASTNALTTLELLRKHGVSSTVEKERWGDHQDAQVVVLGGTYLHDVGNAVHRGNHYIHALFLVNPILREYLKELYPDEKADRIRASILECIYTHDEAVSCLSVEAGCVTVGDGADMANGRARIPFSLGKVDIHSVSALAIKEATITEGEKKPVKIEVKMTESAGVFQIQNVLGEKIESSGIKELIEVVGTVVGEGDKIIESIEF